LRAVTIDSAALNRTLAGKEARLDRWEAANEAEKLLTHHGLVGWRFAFNRRKRAMGLCRYDAQRIELSIHFVESNDAAAVRDTLLHEIAHALAGQAAGHGPRWRRICRQIGATPARCGDAAMPRGQWVATCPGCGGQYERHRRPPSGYHYACSRCGHKRGRLHFKRRELSEDGAASP
jgi:predicted SprT family Zn-dependent metalloprotease